MYLSINTASSGVINGAILIVQGAIDGCRPFRIIVREE